MTLGSTLIRLEGSDALAVLHRISTQSLSDLRPGEARTTLFCDFRGRLLHRAAVGMTPDGTVWLMRDDAPGAELRDFIARHVFREEVRIEDRSHAATVRAVRAGQGLSIATLAARDGVPCAVRLAGDFGLLIEPGPEAPPDPETESARVRAGRPRHGYEVRDTFNPFEVGLAHEVHLAKGCFTGQEALMRMVTYRGVRRRLSRARGPGRAPAVPRGIRQEGATAGVLTSAVADESGWIGLAVLKHEACEATAILEIEDAGAIEVEAFAESRPLGLP